MDTLKLGIVFIILVPKPEILGILHDNLYLLLSLDKHKLLNMCVFFK